MPVYALINCTKDKRKDTCAARDMYAESTLFKKAWAHATGKGQSPLILSAKYGLLLPDTIIETYNQTLIGKHNGERYEWALRVLPDLAQLLLPGDSVVSYMGQVYEEFIVPWLRGHGYPVEQPLKGLGVGQRLGWFTQRARQTP